MKRTVFSVLKVPVILIALSSLSISISFAHQQEFHENGPLPSCESIANDPNGDGYGWVPHITGAHSCIVDQNTKPKPLFAQVGGETRPLNMIRTYWDPNVDFANKEIECTIFRNEDSFTESSLSSAHFDVFTIEHYPLPDVQPYKSEFEVTSTDNGFELTGTNTWRAADGIYFADMHYYIPERLSFVGLFAGYWGEPIDIDGQQGMRFWYLTEHSYLDDPEVIRGSLYQECKYTSGEPFRPTGSFDQTATPSGVTEFEIPSLSVGPSIDQKPEIIHRVSNAMIDLQSSSWNIRDDLLFKKILCLDRQWNGSYFDTYDSSMVNSYTFMPPRAGETSGRLFYQSRHNGASEMTLTYFWSVIDGKIHTTRHNRSQTIGFPVNGGWYEDIVAGASSIVSPEDSHDGVRIWHDDISFDTCWLEVEYSRSGDVLRPTGPTDTTNIDPGSCDYSNADMFSGWGWNEITRESCAPQSISNEPVEQVAAGCDYSNAALYGGWGWNETTRESCAPQSISNEPVEQVAAQVPAGCDYTNSALSGGWGWNETTRESCAPQSASSEAVEQTTAQVPAGCDYSNASLSGGWGWNETTRESCSPL